MSMVPDPVFKDMIDKLRAAAQLADQSLRNQAQARFEDLGVSGSRVEIAQALNRDASARMYHQVIHEGGLTNVLKSAKLTSDFLAGMQRDILAQRSSRIRMLALEASRRKRHGAEDGPILNNLLRLPQALLVKSGVPGLPGI